MPGAVERSFPAPLANVWGTPEAGPMAVGCWRGPGMHLCDDLVVVEPVGQDGRPVPPDVVSDKVLVTAISNPLLPLIRLEITDQVQLLDQPCPCGSAHRLIADIEGRLDDVFPYRDGVVVHPHVFRAALAREVGVVDYQVRQTPTGAEVLVVGTPSDRDHVGRTLAGELARHGVPSPSVRVLVVDGIERQSTRKMRRFVPIAGQAAARRASSSRLAPGEAPDSLEMPHGQRGPAAATSCAEPPWRLGCPWH